MNTNVLFEYLINLFEFLAVIFVLLIALVFQFVLDELPCPLCLLQRIGLLGVAFGFLLNLRFGVRPSHYAIVLMSAIFTSFVALRQISLHVIPGTGAYGSAIFGIHLYTWSFIFSVCIMIVTTLLLGVDTQYLATLRKDPRWRVWRRFVLVAMLLVLVVNIVSVVQVCGLHECPDNPIMTTL